MCVSAWQMAYNIDVVKTNVPEALEILVDSVVNPKFVSWEVNAAINKMREDIKTVKDNPQTVLLEVRGCLQSCATLISRLHQNLQILPPLEGCPHQYDSRVLLFGCSACYHAESGVLCCTDIETWSPLFLRPPR